MSDGAPLRDKVVGGLAWKAISQAVVQGTRIVVAVILARLLAPHDYGVAAMVLVFQSLIIVFSDLGLGAALVQRKTLTEDDRSTVFWISVGGGLAFTLVGIALAGPLASFYNEPEVKDLFRVLSLSFLVTAIGSVQSTLLIREMQFRSLELRVMASILVGAAVGLIAALAGYGAWAIILQQLAISVASTVMLWCLSPWRPHLRFSTESVRSLGRFSANVFGTRVLFYLNRNGDNMLVGRFLGPAALGAYSISYTIMLVPFNQIAGPVQEVLFPALSRMQDDRPAMAAAWIRANRIVGALSIPSLLGLLVVAPDFVQVVLGDKWAAATPVIQVLVWVGLLQSLQRLNSTILQACDVTGDLLRYSVIVTVASIAAFAVGLHWGIVGVAVAFAISSTIVEPYYTLLTVRPLGISILALPRALRRVIEASIAMALAVLATRVLLVSLGTPPGERLGIEIAIGCIVYLPLVWWREPNLRRELQEFRDHRDAAPVAAPQQVATGASSLASPNG